MIIYLVRATAELFSTDSTQSIIENIEPSWTSFVIVLILSTTLFIYMLYKAINQKGFFLILGEKHQDDDQRDKNHMNFDLDLHCHVYDKDKNFLFSIAPQNKKLIPPGMLKQNFKIGCYCRQTRIGEVGNFFHRRDYQRYQTIHFLMRKKTQENFFEKKIKGGGIFFLIFPTFVDFTFSIAAAHMKMCIF